MMKTLLLASAAAFALGMGTANAGERITLTDSQMDKVTAGWGPNFSTAVIAFLSGLDTAYAEASATAFSPDQDTVGTATSTHSNVTWDFAESYSTSLSVED